MNAQSASGKVTQAEPVQRAGWVRVVIHAKHGFLPPPPPGAVEGTEVNRTGVSARAMSARRQSRSPCFFLMGVLEADQ